MREPTIRRSSATDRWSARRHTIVAVVALATVCALPSCLKREETITVRGDGTVAIVHRIAGDREDLEDGIARLPDPAVYRIERGTRTDEKGNVEHTLTASAQFRSAADVPRRFGPAADPLAEAALTFGTEVQVRRDGERTFYRFERRYAARSWAPYRVFRRKAFPQDVEEMIEDGAFWRRSPDERRRIVGAAVAYERMKLAHWAEQGLARVANEHPKLLEAQLAVRAAIQERIEARLGIEAALRILAASADEIHAFCQGLYEEIDELIASNALRLLDLDARAVKELSRALELIRHDHAVTDDLEDEAMSVRLELPGRVIGHNGDAGHGGSVVWNFDGQSMRDRDHVLVAISVVE